MQHIQVPTVQSILYGVVPAFVFFTVNFNDPGISAGVLKTTINAAVGGVTTGMPVGATGGEGPVYLEFSCAITTAFNAGTNAVTIGSTQANANEFMASGDSTPGTIGIYPAANAAKRYLITAPTQLWVKYAGGAGTQQITTATGVGTVTVAGNAAVVVTGAGITGSPITLAVPVTTGAPTVWMPEVVTYLQTNAAAAAIRALYTVGGTGATLTLTAINAAANDSTLNVSLATGTATGITTEATSAATQAGVAGATAGSATFIVTVVPTVPNPSNVGFVG